MGNRDEGIEATREVIKLRYKLVYDIEYRFNQSSLSTVISGFMECNNKMVDLAKKEGGINKETPGISVTLLALLAPHIGEELWQQPGGTDNVFHAQWPECDEEAMKNDGIEVAVQVSSKARSMIQLPVDTSKEDALVTGGEAVKDKLAGSIVEEIYVPDKIINIVYK